jgi:hypothetical protein
MASAPNLWIISDGKAGNDAQAIGVAEALGLPYEVKSVQPKGIWKLLSPYGPVNPWERFGRGGSSFRPPWPAIAIATGRLTTPYIRALKRASRGRTYTVILLDPRTGTKDADLYWVPQHDRLRGPNVITTLTAPHRFSPARLAALRQEVPAFLAYLPSPRVAVLTGGPNGSYIYDAQTVSRLVATLQSLLHTGAGVMITASRRTPPSLRAAVSPLAANPHCIFWNGEGENPYPAFLAHGDAFIVTADSINMTGEACATGRPVYVFEPGGGSEKFRRFHQALRDHGATRPCPRVFESLESWTYQPLYSARLIANEIRTRVPLATLQ